MIRSFRHKGLKELFETGQTRRIAPAFHKRLRYRLDLLDHLVTLQGFNLAGLYPHPLHGTPKRHAISVNGPWRLTFGWDGEHVTDVDFEQYH